MYRSATRSLRMMMKAHDRSRSTAAISDRVRISDRVSESTVGRPVSSARRNSWDFYCPVPLVISLRKVPTPARCPRPASSFAYFLAVSTVFTKNALLSAMFSFRASHSNWSHSVKASSTRVSGSSCSSRCGGMLATRSGNQVASGADRSEPSVSSGIQVSTSRAWVSGL